MKVLLSTMLSIVFIFPSYCQKLRTVSGDIQDSLGNPISSAQILLLSNRDSLKTTTSQTGKFLLQLSTNSVFELIVTSPGYKKFSQQYRPLDYPNDLHLKNIILNPQVAMLDEVIIKGKPRPIIFKLDTIEYDADAYTVRPNDRLSDLVKQLPGIGMDKDGKPSILGKELYKIRVNGEDFFTGNVKEFLDRLPASIVAKLQIIDDHGDLSKLTKIRVDDPPKMLNVITKEGMNKGKFTDLKATVGTNDQFGGDLKTNLWFGQKQFSFSSGYNTAYNGAGTIRNATANILNRQKVHKNGTGTLSYSLNQINKDNLQEGFTETLNDKGSIFTRSLYKNDLRSIRHELKYDLLTGKEMFFFRISLDESKEKVQSLIRESGISTRDLTINRSGRDFKPTISFRMQGYYPLKKPGRYLSVSPRVSYNLIDIKNIQTDLNSYALAGQSGAIRDSILNRLITNSENNYSYQGQLVFSEPINDVASKTKRLIELSHLPSLTISKGLGATSVNRFDSYYEIVDSLNAYNPSLSFSERIALSYKQNNNKVNLEVSIIPSFYLIRGKFNTTLSSIQRSVIKFLPAAGITYTPSKLTVAQLKYKNSVSMPAINQLQTINQNLNLRNIFIGNPKLKRSIIHSLDADYKLTTEKGHLLNFSVGALFYADRIVNSITLLADTITSLKQITSLVNANGYYTINSRYGLVIPLRGQRFSVGISGDVGYTNDVYFLNNSKSFTKSLNVSQQLKFDINTKWLSSTTGANYGFSGNRYVAQTNTITEVSTLNYYTDIKMIVSSSFSTRLSMSKTYYFGYQFNQRNPYLMNFNVEKSLFKKNQAKLTLSVNDILNQGNNLTRILGVNSYTDYRMNQITRYLLASFLVRLDKFGK